MFRPICSAVSPVKDRRLSDAPGRQGDSDGSKSMTVVGNVAKLLGSAGVWAAAEIFTPHLLHLSLRVRRRCGSTMLALGGKITETSMRFSIFVVALLSLAAPIAVFSQPPQFTPPPQFESNEVSADKKLTFRIHAPKAEEVLLTSPDIPHLNGGLPLKKGENDVWEGTTEAVPAGAYRYSFRVDGLAVTDPRNPRGSESNSNAWSLVLVSGSDLFDARETPHGAVAEIFYHSKTLNRLRRAHVYTPPGYETSQDKYPVFYLLHGASDCDDSWSSVGRAGFILDNLIAAGKAKPMVIVMPAGHTGAFQFGGRDNSFEKQMQEFQDDFTKDLRPYVEAHYRLLDGSANRAIAGLSMGGAQTLNIAFSKLDDYGYVGVYSSGIFGITGGFGGQGPNTTWEDGHKGMLDSEAMKKGLKLVWFGCGADDFLIGTSDATVDMLKKHGLDVQYSKTAGGHTWLVWRDYLAEFSQKLFQ